MRKENFSCVMAYVVNKKLRNAIVSFFHSIPDELLFNGRDEDGDRFDKPPDPHVTILYGIKTSNINEIIKPFKDIHYISFKLGKVTFFDHSNKKWMVLKVEVQSNTLDMLNNRIKRELDFEKSFDEYHPHITIAYLKKNSEVKQKYNGIDIFNNFHDITNIIDISTGNGHKYFYNLTEKELRKAK